MSATITPTPAPAAFRRGAAVLVAGCDGYAAGTTGHVLGTRSGCVVFAPDRPEAVARWAVARRELVVPPGFLVSAR